MYSRKLITKNILRSIFFSSVLILPSSVWCQGTQHTKSIKDGWAILIGAGVMYGGNLGFLTERQIQIKKKFRFSPFISEGIGEAGTDSTTAKKYYWLGYASGFNLEYGNTHRVILGTHAECNNLIGHTDVVKKKLFSGFSIIAGYKGTADFGLIWQLYIGDFYSSGDDPFSANKKYAHSSQIGIGLGYKL
jgi:hypothetical protein